MEKEKIKDRFSKWQLLTIEELGKIVNLLMGIGVSLIGYQVNLLFDEKFVSRESHYLFGKRYLLKVIETDKPSKVVIKNKKQIEIHDRSGSTIDQRSMILNKWYRTELKKVIPNLVSKWEKKMNVSLEYWGIKQMKTKWGTCNIEAKRIWLNLELAKKPMHCLEYIIVHELVHLLERKHNDRFLAIINKYMPQWKTHRDELNRLPVSHINWEY